MSVTEAARPSLAEQLLAPERRDLRLAVADGLLPLALEELIPLLVTLARLADDEVAGRADTALRRLDPRIAVGALQESAEPEVLAHFALRLRHPAYQETVLRRREVPRWILIELASLLGADLQEVLLLRQDAIVEEPAILDALERNPGLTPFARGRIAEYRAHLLPRPLPARNPYEVEADLITAEAVEEAIREARRGPAEAEVDLVTGLSESQIRNLPLIVRLKLGRGAPRGLRNILIRDTNPMVAVSVFEHNAFSDSEIVHIANSRSVVAEVLDRISRERQWMRRYGIVVGLARNPRTPVAVAMKLLSRLTPRDLRDLGHSYNVAEAVRRQAGRLYKIKAQ